VISTAKKQAWDILSTLTAQPDHLVTKLQSG
jgi:hypothetical protein